MSNIRSLPFTNLTRGSNASSSPPANVAKCMAMLCLARTSWEIRRASSGVACKAAISASEVVSEI
jgi:hypothetical protein